MRRVARALAEREQDLRAARAQVDRREGLASLATLAAGAAHELSTPLSTIAVVAKELQRALGEQVSDEVRADLQLVRDQVGRCREILDRMSAAATQASSAIAAIGLPAASPALALIRSRISRQRPTSLRTSCRSARTSSETCSPSARSSSRATTAMVDSGVESSWAAPAASVASDASFSRRSACARAAAQILLALRQGPRHPPHEEDDEDRGQPEGHPHAAQVRPRASSSVLIPSLTWWPGDEARLVHEERAEPGQADRQSVQAHRRGSSTAPSATLTR